jgi:hypothetical protein
MLRKALKDLDRKCQLWPDDAVHRQRRGEVRMELSKSPPGGAGVPGPQAESSPITGALTWSRGAAEDALAVLGREQTGAAVHTRAAITHASPRPPAPSI